MRLATGSHGYPSAGATIACCIQPDIDDAFLSEPTTGNYGVNGTDGRDLFVTGCRSCGFDLCALLSSVLDGRSDSPTRVSGAAMWMIR